MSRKPKQTGDVDYSAVIARYDEQSAETEALATDPEFLKLVQRNTRKKHGQTPLLPVRCGSHSTGVSLTFSVDKGQVCWMLDAPGKNVFYSMESVPDVEQDSRWELQRQVQIQCAECGKPSKPISRLRLLREGRKALAAMEADMTRPPVVRF